MFNTCARSSWVHLIRNLHKFLSLSNLKTPVVFKCHSKSIKMNPSSYNRSWSEYNTSNSLTYESSSIRLSFDSTDEELPEDLRGIQLQKLDDQPGSSNEQDSLFQNWDDTPSQLPSQLDSKIESDRVFSNLSHDSFNDNFGSNPLPCATSRSSPYQYGNVTPPKDLLTPLSGLSSSSNIGYGFDDNAFGGHTLNSHRIYTNKLEENLIQNNNAASATNNQPSSILVNQPTSTLNADYGSNPMIHKSIDSSKSLFSDGYEKRAHPEIEFSEGSSLSSYDVYSPNNNPMQSIEESCISSSHDVYGFDNHNHPMQGLEGSSKSSSDVYGPGNDSMVQYSMATSESSPPHLYGSSIQHFNQPLNSSTSYELSAASFSQCPSKVSFKVSLENDSNSGASASEAMGFTSKGETRKRRPKICLKDMNIDERKAHDRAVNRPAQDRYRAKKALQQEELRQRYEYETQRQRTLQQRYGDLVEQLQQFSLEREQL